MLIQYINASIASSLVNRWVRTMLTTTTSAFIFIFSVCNLCNGAVIPKSSNLDKLHYIFRMFECFRCEFLPNRTNRHSIFKQPSTMLSVQAFDRLTAENEKKTRNRTYIDFDKYTFPRSNHTRETEAKEKENIRQTDKTEYCDFVTDWFISWNSLKLYDGILTKKKCREMRRTNKNANIKRKSIENCVFMSVSHARSIRSLQMHPHKHFCRNPVNRIDWRAHIFNLIHLNLQS